MWPARLVLATLRTRRKEETMNGLLILAAVVVLAVAILLLLRGPFKAWRYYRAPRVVTCPDNHQAAAVSVNAVRAAVSSPDHPALRLDSCSRWPEKAGCGQECLKQVHDQPDDCMVRTMVARWYEGKSCAICGRAIKLADWHFENPAVLGPDGAPRQWSSFAAEELPGVFATHRAVCGNCYLNEGFRAAHPELVSDRPAR